jgi:hypothetical protein
MRSSRGLRISHACPKNVDVLALRMVARLISAAKFRRRHSSRKYGINGGKPARWGP